jgi:hypothetical protein
VSRVRPVRCERLAIRALGLLLNPLQTVASGGFRVGQFRLRHCLGPAADEPLDPSPDIADARPR